MRRLAAVLATVLAVHCSAAEPEGHDEACRANLRAIAAGLKGYLIANEVKLPPSLRPLYTDGYVLSLDVLVCPASKVKIASEAEIDAKTSYELTKTLEGAKPLLLIREKAGNHGGKALGFYSDFRIREVGAAGKPDPPPPPPELTAEALHAKGVALLEKGKLPEAEGYLRMALSKSPGSAAYANDVGNVQLHQKKFDGAAMSFALAARLDPRQPVYFHGQARALAQLGKWQEAVGPCAAAVALAPKAAILHNDLGNIHYQLRKWSEASVAYYHAVQAEPKNGLYHANYAGALYLLGRRADAERVARGALGLGHRNHWVYKKLGLVR